MAKDSISGSESRSLYSLADIFNPISPNAELSRNILHGFWKLGLIPILRREVDGELVDLGGRSAEQEDGTDSYLFLPSEVAANIGSDTSTWVRWGTLACNSIHQHLAEQGQVGLTGEMLLDTHVPTVTLPEETVRALSQRGHRTHRRVKLVSLPVVAFFLAAQYGAWADPEEVATVTPFKNLLHQLGIVVRQCDVRRPSKPSVELPIMAIEPVAETPPPVVSESPDWSIEPAPPQLSEDALDAFLKNIKAVASASAPESTSIQSALSGLHPSMREMFEAEDKLIQSALQHHGHVLEPPFLPVAPPNHRSAFNPVVGAIMDSATRVPFSFSPDATSPSGAAQDTTLDELSIFTEDDSSMNATTDIDALIREHESILRALRTKKTLQDLRTSVVGAVVEEVYVEGDTPIMRLRRGDNSVFDVLVPASMIPARVPMGS